MRIILEQRVHLPLDLEAGDGKEERIDHGRKRPSDERHRDEHPQLDRCREIRAAERESERARRIDAATARYGYGHELGQPDCRSDREGRKGSMLLVGVDGREIHEDADAG